jgi:uncharacterized RDD family membrane protein YckC
LILESVVLAVVLMFALAIGSGSTHTAAGFVALGIIGYFVWLLAALSYGQSPGKQLVGLRVVKIDSGQAAGFGTMLLREVIAKPIIGVLSWLTLGIVYFWLLWDKDTQQLWDKVVDTLVVNDRAGLTLWHR